MGKFICKICHALMGENPALQEFAELGIAFLIRKVITCSRVFISHLKSNNPVQLPVLKIPHQRIDCFNHIKGN